LDNKTLRGHFFIKDIQPDQTFNEQVEKYDCYVVLFDMGLWPDSGNRARKLFNSISSKRKLMVGCKSDLFHKNKARRTHCVQCSVVTHKNVDNVFEQITEILQFKDTPNIPLTKTHSDGYEPSRSHKNVKKLFRRRTISKNRTVLAEESEGSDVDKSYSQAVEMPNISLPTYRKASGYSSGEADVDDTSTRTEDSIAENLDAEEEFDLRNDSSAPNIDITEEKSVRLGSDVDSKQLLQQVWRQNVRAFSKYLKDLKKSGTSFNISDPVNASGDSLLHELVRKPGWLSSLKVIVQSNVLSPNEVGMLLNSKNNSGDTPLHVAAFRGLTEYVPTLLSCNANVLTENNRGYTALHAAIEMNSAEIVKLLIENKEVVKVNSALNYTPYQLSLDLGRTEIAQILHPFFETAVTPADFRMEQEMNLLKNNFFDLIKEEKLEEIADMLIRFPELVNHRDSVNNRTPLHSSVLGREESMVPSLLLEAGADINAQDANGNTPLHLASSHKEGLYFVKLLLEQQASVSIPNNEGNLPFVMAIYCDNFELVEFFLSTQSPSDIGLQLSNNEKNTPLHVACAICAQSPHFDHIVQAMTEKGAATGAINSRKETPLHLAATAGCVKIHPSLCDQIDTRDIFGNTPLLCAARSMNLVAVQSLLDMGAAFSCSNTDNENILHMIAFRRFITEADEKLCISLLKKLERKPSFKDNIKQLLGYETVSKNETPLFYAIHSSRFKLAQFFLRRGSQPNIENISGDTPLHCAVQTGSRVMVDLLLRKEIPANHQNKEGYTPLHYACDPKHNVIADRLLKKLHSSDLLATTTEGLTTLHLAAQAGNLHLVQALVEKSLRKDGTSQLIGMKTQHNNTALIYAMSNNHSKVASYLAKRNNLDRVEAEIMDRVEFRKLPFPHIYPVVNHDHVKINQRLDIFSTVYNIYEGKLRDEDILILECNSPTSAICLAHEVAIMSMIGSHPNVQRLLGASQNKYCYLPYLSNCSTLDSILTELMFRRETCDILQVLTIIEGVANGMKCLHTATVSKPIILHNALSPRAILVDEQNAKISSFVAARVHFSEESIAQDKKELPLPQMDEVRYLAPEILRGEAPSKKSDVFSFGMVFWQLATTKIPYSEIPLSDLIAVKRKDVLRPSIEGIDKGIAELIVQCWNSDPAQRPSFSLICDKLNNLHVEKVEALGRTRSLPVFLAKGSPFPCCKPREFQIMNKLKKSSKEKSNSSIYLCTFERIVCVVKMWPPNQTQQEQMKSSLQTFTIKSLCECDSIVRYIYSDTDKNGNKCLFMEYMNQGTVANLINLRQASKITSFTPQEIIHYAMPIAQALEFMHKFSTVIVHQDIQAENVYLTCRDSSKTHIVKLGGFSAMHTLQNSEEHEVYRDIEGFALYLYQLLTFTTRVKNNWKSQAQKLQLPTGNQKFVPILHDCLDPLSRPSSAQLVARFEELIEKD